MTLIYQFLPEPIGKILLKLFTVLLLSVFLDAAAAEKPNVIIVITDDQGYGDLGCHGNPILKTPHIDAFYKDAVRLDNYHVDPTCAPTRSALMTGRYSDRVGVWHTIQGRNMLRRRETTMADIFKANGYATGLFGKWHLGTEPRGFDTFKYHNSAGQQGHYWNPVFNENGNDVKEKGYATNLSTDFAINWLESIKSSEDPFLMLLQFKAPHRSWQPDTKYEQLWDEIEMPYPATYNDTYEGREKQLEIQK